MKKVCSIVSLLFILLPALVFAGGAKETSAVAPEKQMTHDELVAAAKAEGNLTIYTISSRTAKIGAAFEAKYGIKTSTTQLKDSEMVEKTSKEAAANLDAADIIFCQDGARVYPELILAGYVKNYVPSSQASLIAEKYQDPLVWEVCNKVFIYNNEKEGQTLTNVWQLTDPSWKGRVQMKDSFQEGINMNFFTMLTRDDWAKKLSDAYKDLYGKDLVLTTKNAGYEWIKMLYKNGLVLGKSDTTIAENIGAKGQPQQLVGLFTANKLRTAKDKNLSLAPSQNVKPFSGFFYPVYAFITSNAKSPNAAKLFLEFSMTSEGWAPFDTIGDYSPKADLKNSEDTISFDEWTKMLVFEDPQWCAENRAEVEEFISSII
ncbi:MAG: ABC transporter substrate-binding protein [Sphaerochaetaceae bacterium]